MHQWKHIKYREFIYLFFNKQGESIFKKQRLFYNTNFLYVFSMWLVCLSFPHQGPVNTAGLMGGKGSNVTGSGFWPLLTFHPLTPSLQRRNWQDVQLKGRNTQTLLLSSYDWAAQWISCFNWGGERNGLSGDSIKKSSSKIILHTSGCMSSPQKKPSTLDAVRRQKRLNAFH